MMEQFNKWAGPVFYYGKDPLDRPTLEAKRKAWRAALKWALEELDKEESFETFYRRIKDEVRDT